MKTTIQILGVLALAGSISLAEGDRKGDRKRPNPADIIKKLDTDGSGSISKSEFMAGERAQKDPERAAKAFAHMDDDGDGELTTKDFAQRRRGGEGGPNRPNPAEIFKKLDADGSGSISKAEFMGTERAQQNPEMAGKHFDKLDADGSGDITRDEFAQRPNRGDRRGGGDGPRPGNRGDKPGDNKGGANIE